MRTQMAIVKDYVPRAGEPGHGIDVRVQPDHVEFVVWGDGVHVAIRMSREEAFARGRELAAALAGKERPRIIIPGQAQP